MHRLEPEIALIHDPELVSFVRMALSLAPDYFWTVTSSTSGKRHPPDERGPGGRVLHAKRVARLCSGLADSLGLNVDQFDVLVASAIIHDLVVNGTESTPMGRNWPLHDVALRTYLKDLEPMLNDSLWTALMRTCEAHMGIWGSSPTLEPQLDELGYLLNIADGIASQTWVLVEPLEAPSEF